MVSLKKICNELNIQINISEDINISSLNTLKDSDNTQLTFLENKKYKNDLSTTNAAAVLVREEFKELVPSDTIALVCEEPYIALAYASKFFAPDVIEQEGGRSCYR